MQNLPTDFGPEANTAQARTILPTLFNRPADPTERLFPNALKWIGWNHNWDNAIRYVLNSKIPWYPEFALQFKLVVRFLRNNSYTDVLIKILIDGDHEYEAATLGTKSVGLAKWRWGLCSRLSAESAFASTPYDYHLR